jgi:hypothetical protein
MTQPREPFFDYHTTSLNVVFAERVESAAAGYVGVGREPRTGQQPVPHIHHERHLT